MVICCNCIKFIIDCHGKPDRPRKNKASSLDEPLRQSKRLRSKEFLFSLFLFTLLNIYGSNSPFGWTIFK